MVVFFQETHLHCPPTINELSKFNFNIAHFVHGVLTCIDKTIEIKRTKIYYNDKVELIVSNIHAHKSICIFNIYVAPFASISTIVDTISVEKKIVTKWLCLYSNW
jgi:hypothetical protein